ncbi:MAG: MlaD family protein [Thermodesulfobacteriota bacterium]
MSRKASPAYIGAFVVGAVILAVLGVLIFGSGSFFKEKYTYVIYFGGSIKGLNVGAPMEMRGVKVGAVKEILLECNTGDAVDIRIRIPVLVEYEANRISDGVGGTHPKEFFDGLVERGLRAQLQLQSVVTGQLMVELDFYPDTPANLVGIHKEYPEIPSIPSMTEELTKTLANIPFEELLNKIIAAVDGIEKIVSSPEITKTMHSMQSTMKEVRLLIDDVRDKIEPLSVNMKQTAMTAQKMMEQTDKTLVLVEDILADDSAPRSELREALDEFTGAARAIRLLADYLERHPEALLKGKREER